jgi:glycosyltransferase involved in cell wall biosynthesis
MPRLSIVIPTRQRADTLVFAIETALAQTHPDYEIVVQNNGNDQATNDVVASFQSRRIVLTGSAEILPMAANWEAALAASSGEYIAFMGDDDGMMPDACAICDELLSNRPSLGALHWTPHYYDWPTSLRAVARNRLVVKLPGPEAATIRRCRDLLHQLYEGTIDWTDLPLIYNGAFVRRSVIEKVKAFCGGRYFAGQIPDVHSGIANLWAMEQFLHIDRALSICGASGHSNGNAHFVGSSGGPLQARFHAENPALHQVLGECFLDTTNMELTIASALMVAKEMFFKDDPDISLNMRNVLLRMGRGANRDPTSYDRTISEMHLVAQKYAIDTSGFNLPPKRLAPDAPIQGPVADQAGRATHLVVNGTQAGLATIADAVRLAASMLPSATPAKLSAATPRAATQPHQRVHVRTSTPPAAALVAGLRIPHLFWGMKTQPAVVEALNTLVARVGDTGDPRGAWFLADNLITIAHTRGFLTEPRLVAAVTAERPSEAELAIVWRTHTLCWAAESCLAVMGDYVECGTYQGYSMAVVLRYLAGLPGRQCFLYDLFDPSGGEGEGKRLPAHAPNLFERVRTRFHSWPNVLVTRGKVPDVLAEVAPSSIAFLHIDMNNAQAERGALEVLFDRISPGGLIVFDDYGWNGYREQKDAADTFMQERGLAVLELPTGQGLVVKR